LTMVLKLILGPTIGALIGFIIGSIFRKLGGVCPLTCNPYISTIWFAILGLLLALK